MPTQQHLQPSARQLDTVLEQLTHASASNAPDDAAALFADDSYWRDLVMFTWNLRTMEGRDQIRDMLTQQEQAAMSASLSVIVQSPSVMMAKVW